ncbi:putative DUF4145 family protein (plasmid) [Corynebacterium mustelae]|uniref:Putative DUF4145 family protein n=3 Tax=Corynebacterium mustelae TaxID=571915 RepID=A0A0G3H2B2_9CORY|nr:putative DUF4145 family protein [Corynebacterium mustelae]AKK07457.1 putative DUF4145 family protein [Corynebacterium mustelae]
MLKLAETYPPGAWRHPEIYSSSVWLLCLSCGQGVWGIIYGGSLSIKVPEARPKDVPDHLSSQVRLAWEEALDCFAASAYTSSTLMCRKLLFHMAVEMGLSEKKENGFSPNFDECLQYLVDEGFITARQRNQWVESIRVWGNKATHDLASIDKDTAEKAIDFMYQLLQIVYTFPASSGQESPSQ